MAKEARKPLVSFTSERGTFVYPKLTEPDYGTKEFPKPDGEFSLRLRMSQAAAETFINKKNKQGVSLASIHEAAMEAGRSKFAELPVATRKKLKELTEQPLYAEVYDKETEEPTGDVEFKFAMKASGEIKSGPRAGTKWKSDGPNLFDATGGKVAKGVPIWGGTEGKVAFKVSPDGYFIAGQGLAGVKLMLDAVQIIELVTSGGKSAEGYGFGEEEGGYAFSEDDVQGDGGGGDDTPFDNEGDSGDEPSEEELGF